MKNFKELGISPQLKSFRGDKIKIDRILNREIIVQDYKIENSKFDKGNGKCLYMQIEINGTQHILFSGSSVLMDTIQQVPKDAFPFKTTIVKESDHFEFS